MEEEEGIMGDEMIMKEEEGIMEKTDYFFAAHSRKFRYK